MFGVPIKDMPGEVRRRAKAINFGIIYGISAFGLANQLGIAREEASRLHQEVFRALPRHPRLHGRDARSSAASNGYVETLFGRKMPLPGHQGVQRLGARLQRARRRSTRACKAPPPTSSAAP